MKEKLASQIVTIRTIGVALFIFVVGAIPVVVFNFVLVMLDKLLLAILLDIILIPFVILVSYAIAKLSYNMTYFEIASEGLILQRGIIFRKNTTIPYARIQNIDIYQGPILSIFNLKSVRVQTAGSVQQLYEASIAGLKADRADQVRDELLKRAKEAKS